MTERSDHDEQRAMLAKIFRQPTSGNPRTLGRVALAREAAAIGHVATIETGASIGTGRSVHRRRRWVCTCGSASGWEEPAVKDSRDEHYRTALLLEWVKSDDGR